MVILSIIFESVVLASSCSLDAFTAGFAYGNENIHIPWQSGQVINIICSFVLGLSLIFGTVLRPFLPDGLAQGLAFLILFAIGFVKLSDSVTKSIIRRHNKKNRENLKKQLQFSLLNFSFILNLYANPIDADINVDKVISPREAVVLALSLSLDGLAVGFGAALGSANPFAVTFSSLVLNSIAVFCGVKLGRKLAGKLAFDISWLSGAILIILAFIKL